MNRLTDIYLGNTHSQIIYDPLGRMTDKQADGQSVFANAAFAAAQGQPSRPHAMTSAETVEGVFPSASQEITYTGFDKVKTIAEGSNTLAYTYGYDQQRIRMVENVGDITRTKDYVGVCEYIAEDDGENTTEKTLTYLVGPYGVFAVVEQQNSEESIHYILKDHLGSWTTITDAEGNVEQELSFDAWGNPRNPATWNGGFSGMPMFDRGFTGHEHLYAFGLINMNGRMYDPKTSSFLSVDAYVQSPDNSQSFNRYAYCLNNPLKYTDPSGWVMQGGMTPGNSFHENWGVNFAEHVVTSHEAREILRNMGVPLGVWMEEKEVHGGGSPIYDEHGVFMGTDEGGLQGEIIVMRRGDFVQGMKHEEALALATYLDENDKDAEIRLYNHYKGLSNRPDWDGFVTIDEGIAWAKTHMGALDHPTPDNMLYINASLLDFGSLSVADFEYGEGNVSFVNLYTYSNFINSVTNNKLRSTVYALGKVHILLENASQGTISIHNDCFSDKDRVTDYDWNGGGGLKRSIGIMLEKKRAGIPEDAGFRVYYYGKGQLYR